MGISMPDMGTTVGSPAVYRVSEALAPYACTRPADALFTATQQRVLACLFAEPERDYSVSELIHETGAGSGAVQRELARLAGSGLLRMEKVGNQKRYRADPASPVYAELAALVRKAIMPDPQLSFPLTDTPVRAYGARP